MNGTVSLFLRQTGVGWAMGGGIMFGGLDAMSRFASWPGRLALCKDRSSPLNDH